MRDTVRKFAKFLFVERMGYRRPSAITAQDVVDKIRQEARTARLEREVAILDATHEVWQTEQGRKRGLLS